MTKSEILRRTERFVKDKLGKEGTGHDWWHVYRVWKNALKIAKREKADLFIVELGALLHDIADHKFHGGDDTVGPRVAAEWLKSLGMEEKKILLVSDIVQDVSFKGSGEISKIKSIEGKIVQDADRLDAIGAIGIARAFAYGGHKGRLLYDPSGSVKKNQGFEEYKKGADSTIHHFYEKLLLLKKLMNTKTGKAIAERRHNFMKNFLNQFFKEWEGK